MKSALNTLPDAFDSQYFDLDDAGDAQEFYHSRGWTDGFPICLLYTSDAADE